MSVWAFLTFKYQDNTLTSQATESPLSLVQAVEYLHEAYWVFRVRFLSWSD